MSNPLNGLVGSKELLESKQLLDQYREGREPPGTTETQVCSNSLKSVSLFIESRAMVVSALTMVETVS